MSSSILQDLYLSKQSFLSGGGECGELIRSANWSNTPVGPIESWPQSLKTMVGVMLENKFGMYIAWGKEFTQFYNDGYRPILGSTKHPKAMGNTCDVTFAESWDIIRPLFEKVMRGEAVGSEDWLLPLNRHGFLEDCYFTFCYSPIRDDKGEVGGVLVTVTETTSRVRGEAALKNAIIKTEATERKLAALLEEAPVGIAATQGPNHVFTLTNKNYLELLFGEERNLVGLAVIDTLPEVRNQGFIELLDQVYNTGESYFGTEVPLTVIQRDGKEKKIYVNFIYQASRDLMNNVSGIFCVVYDVTALVLAREMIKVSEENYRSLTEVLPQLMWSSSPDGNVNYANKQCLEYTGLASEEKYGEGWIATIHPEDLPEVGKLWGQSMATGTHFQAEYRIKKADGSYRWFLGRAVPVRNKHGEIEQWIGTATDIDKQRKALDKLELETKLREQFVATLTHDLRNPLTSARISAQLLSRSYASAEKLTSHSGRIVDNLTRADQMIENLLDANRIKAGEELRLEKSEMSLYSLVGEVLTELTTVYGDRFVLESNDKVLNGFWNVDALRRIIENLCTNAIKYGSKSRPVNVLLNRADKVASISVHNFENPIPPEGINELFEPFKRAKKTQDSKGWGLGLTLVKGFTEAHGGNIKVESNELEGTTFKIIFPLTTQK